MALDAVERSATPRVITIWPGTVKSAPQRCAEAIVLLGDECADLGFGSVFLSLGHIGLLLRGEWGALPHGRLVIEKKPFKGAVSRT